VIMILATDADELFIVSYHDAGRAKVVIKKKNVVGEHNVPFQVYYEYNPTFMLADPSTLWAVIIVVVCVAYSLFQAFSTQAGNQDTI